MNCIIHLISSVSLVLSHFLSNLLCLRLSSYLFLIRLDFIVFEMNPIWMYILLLYLFTMCFLSCHLLTPLFLSSYTFIIIYFSKSLTSVLNLFTFFLCLSAYLCLSLFFSLPVSVTPCPSFFPGKIVLRCFQPLYYNNFMHPPAKKKSQSYGRASLKKDFSHTKLP